MDNLLLLGIWRLAISLPEGVWQKQARVRQKKFESATSFITPRHRAVHHFVVRELPGLARPMPPEFVADGLGIALDEVVRIMDDLQNHMTFLYRDGAGNVIWAYPVTVEPTPHRLTFDSGEEIYAA